MMFLLCLVLFKKNGEEHKGGCGLRLVEFVFKSSNTKAPDYCLANIKINVCLSFYTKSSNTEVLNEFDILYLCWDEVKRSFTTVR